jgi:hypothetical protein
MTITPGTVARIKVERGQTTEFPMAEKLAGGWQNGVNFYPDETVTEVIGEYAPKPGTIATLAELEALPDGAVILAQGTAYQKDGKHWWEASGYDRPYTNPVLMEWQEKYGVTITILWKGDQ